MRKLLGRLRPRMVRPSETATGYFGIGVETYVIDYEAQFVWGSQDAGADREVIVHLGTVALVWSWAVRS